MKTTTFSIEEICCCRHDRSKHVNSPVYSPTAKDVIMVEKCSGKGCGCCKFQKSPFAPASGRIVEVLEEKLVKIMGARRQEREEKSRV